jgi:IS30 family transposase
MISVLKKEGRSPKNIALKLGRDPSTIYREIKRNGHEGGYFPRTAQLYAALRKSKASSHPRISKEIKEYVAEKLQLQWSPDQISKRLELESGLKVSHEWIYSWLERERTQGGRLHLNLRWGKKKRKKRFGSRDKRGQIPNRVSIEKRPELVNQRGRIGDWEGDTIIGKNHRGKLVTLVDRVSLLTRIRKVENKTAAVVCQSIIQTIRTLADSFFSLTLDNGTEFTYHEEMTQTTGIPIYFCHPYSSFERGTNENTNGLIRQYFPKITDISLLTEQEVQKVEDLLNHRPRKKLGYLTPYEVHFSK